MTNPYRISFLLLSMLAACGGSDSGGDSGAPDVESLAAPETGFQMEMPESSVPAGRDSEFCMTARLGFQRHLDAGEIVGQVAALLAEDGAPHGGANIVFMGMGEPLHNFEAVVRSLALLAHPNGSRSSPAGSRLGAMTSRGATRRLRSRWRPSAKPPAMRAARWRCTRS